MPLTTASVLVAVLGSGSFSVCQVGTVGAAGAVGATGATAAAAIEGAVQQAQVAAAKHGASLILVDAGIRALAAAAASWRSRFDLEVIGVTGSAGTISTDSAKGSQTRIAMPCGV